MWACFPEVSSANTAHFFLIKNDFIKQHSLSLKKLELLLEKRLFAFLQKIDYQNSFHFIFSQSARTFSVVESSSVKHVDIRSVSTAVPSTLRGLTTNYSLTLIRFFKDWYVCLRSWEYFTHTTFLIWILQTTKHTKWEILHRENQLVRALWCVLVSYCRR